MSLLEQINADMIQAMRDKDELVRDTLRGVKTTIKNTEIAKGQPLDDGEVVDVISKQVKQRLEAAQTYKDGGRPELADKEEQEMAILKKYLPEQLSEDQVSALVDEAIAETSASAMSDMGKVMAALMPKVKGKADGNLVSQLVRNKLN